MERRISAAIVQPYLISMLFDKNWFDARDQNSSPSKVDEFSLRVSWAMEQTDINAAANVVTCNLIVLTDKIKQGKITLAAVLKLIEEAPINTSQKEWMTKAITQH